MNTETFGKKLTKLRKEYELTQKELAEKINYSDKVISKWERGESLPDILVLSELADFYGITLDELVNGTEAKKVTSNNELKVIKTKAPHPIITLAVLTWVPLWVIIFIRGQYEWYSLYFLLYIVLLIPTGYLFNHHEWDTSYNGHSIRVINKFHKTELWVNNKLVDVKYSVASVGVDLSVNIDEQLLKFKVFRFVVFKCELIV